MKKKRILTLFLSLSLIFTLADSISFAPDFRLHANAEDTVTQDYLTFETFDDYAVVKSCDKRAQTVIIPSEVNGLPVTYLGDYSFSECSNLVEVVIPDSVKRIGNGAFSGSGITTITLPKGIRSIGKRMFSYCGSLNDLIIPDTVIAIGANAFEGCAISNITIPDSVTSIGECAFYHCQNLTSITVPDSVTKIERAAFGECSELKRIPYLGHITSIEEKVFEDCTSLKTVTIPDNITSIGKEAFARCTELSRVIIPESVTNIDSHVFDDCNKLAAIYGVKGSYAEQAAALQNIPFFDVVLGDLDQNGDVSVEDAQLVLLEYVKTITGLDSSFTENQKLAGDVNDDKAISVEDAQTILLYYVSNTLSGKNVTWDELLGK